MATVRFAPGAPADRASECAALVHGFMANTAMLAVLGHRLRARGFATTAWGYWNMQCSLLIHAQRFARDLERLDHDPRIGVLHVVGHSMGCIISRAALDLYRPGKIGRFVMLAPPNRGSFVATATAHTFGRILKPVAELSTAGDSLVNSLPTPRGIDIGVIAAKHDALVAEESTRPDVPHAHITLPTWHTGLLFRPETADLVAGFLSTGGFPPLTAAPSPR